MGACLRWAGTLWAQAGAGARVVWTISSAVAPPCLSDLAAETRAPRDLGGFAPGSQWWPGITRVVQGPATRAGMCRLAAHPLLFPRRVHNTGQSFRPACRRRMSISGSRR